MAKSKLSLAAWFLKETILSPVYRSGRLERRDGLVQAHQTDLRAAWL
jgi:hypothetical protein